MKNLDFRAPGSGGNLRDLVIRAWVFAAAEQIDRAFARGDVRVDRAVERNPSRIVSGGARIRVVAGAGGARGAAPTVEVLHRGEDYCVVQKPVGWPSHPAEDGGRDARQLVARALAWPLEEIWPAHRLDADVGGAWLIALTASAAGRLSQHFEQSNVTKEYRALVPPLPWTEGVFRAGIEDKKAETRFRVVAVRGELLEVSLIPVTGRTHQLRLHLADASSPIVGDPLYGGVMVEGGLRLYNRRIAIEAEGLDVVAPEPPGFLPDERVFPRPHRPVQITVSNATVQAMRRGHPWVLTDGETSDVGAFRPGTLANVVGVDGADAGLGLIEGTGKIAARAWVAPGKARAATSAFDEDLRRRVDAALAGRARWLADRGGDRGTTALRLIHGEADGLPGVAMDLLGEELRMIAFGRACEPLLVEIAERVRAYLMRAGTGSASGGNMPASSYPVALVKHLAERPKGEFLSVEALIGEPRHDPFLIRERGLSYWVEHGFEEPTRSRPGFGIFIDQRDNRARVAQQIERHRGGRWLNLFCHTGAFSVAALAAGADHVTSVDLSAAYLRTLEQNLAANDLGDLAARHTPVKMDAERYLERLPAGSRFDGIILDPPTAAASGGRFWSVKKRQAGLLRECLARLTKNGVLLACRNDHGGKGTLRETVEREAGQAGIRLAALDAAPPGSDFPRLAGFPEGDAFEGVLARVR